MVDLVDKFYLADLSESEEEALDVFLASSPEAAGLFADKAAEAYARYGLPDPGVTKGPGFSSRWSLGFLALVLVLMAGYGWWRREWAVKAISNNSPDFKAKESVTLDSGKTGFPVKTPLSVAQNPFVS